MKKLILFLVLSIAYFNINAQDSATLRKNISGIFEDSRNGFAKTQGGISKEATARHSFYKSKVSLGASKSEIYVINSTNGKSYFAEYNYKNAKEKQTAKACLAAAKSLIKEYTATNKYKSETADGYDFEYEEDTKLTEIRDSNGLLALQLTEGKLFFKIIIYSEKWWSK